MAKVTRQEALKIAHMSHIDVRDDEIEGLITQLEEVLSYAERVKEVAADIQEPSIRNINVLREDVIVKTDNEPILSQSPEREGNFFVVPVIIESNT